LRGITIVRPLVTVAFISFLAPFLAAQVPSLTYRQARDIALARNLELAAARRSRAVREADVLTARQRPNPDFSMEVSRDAPHEIFSLALPLELGGKRARRVELAREQVSLADLDERQALTSLLKALRQSFYGLLAADEKIRLTEEVLKIAERVREVASERFAQGDAPRLDVIRAELGVARARAELDLAESSRTAALADLNTVLNQPAGQGAQLSGSLLDSPAGLSFEHAMELASKNNLELQTADRELAVEQRRLALLRAERAPTPTISVGLVTNAPGDYAAGAAAGITVPLPLFSRNQGEIVGSLATMELMRAHGEAVRRSVENRVFAAVARIEAHRKQVETYQQRLIPAALDLEQLAEESYRLGRDPILAVLDVQRSLRDVKQESLQAQLDYQMAIADLEEIIGGFLE
jgi:cobalt-zinc-cadmium efflux system outer membrane protein